MGMKTKQDELKDALVWMAGRAADGAYGTGDEIDLTGVRDDFEETMEDMEALKRR